MLPATRKITSQKELAELPDEFEKYTLVYVANPQPIMLDRYIKKAVFLTTKSSNLIHVSHPDILFYSSNYTDIILTNSSKAAIKSCRTLTVEDKSKAIVETAGSVVATGSSTVFAHQNVNVRAFDYSTIHLNDWASCEAFDQSTIRAFQNASVTIFSKDVNIAGFYDYSTFNILSYITTIDIKNIEPTVNSIQAINVFKSRDSFRKKYPELVEGNGIYFYVNLEIDHDNLKSYKFRNKKPGNLYSSPAHVNPFSWAIRSNYNPSLPIYLCWASFDNILDVWNNEAYSIADTFTVKALVNKNGEIIKKFDEIPDSLQKCPL